MAGALGSQLKAAAPGASDGSSASASAAGGLDLSSLLPGMPALPTAPTLPGDPNLSGEQNQASTDLISALQTQTQGDMASLMARYGTMLAQTGTSPSRSPLLGAPSGGTG